MNQPALIVTVKSEHLAKHPKTKSDSYAFAYHISITNHLQHSVQLMTRHWLITDGNGKTTEVDGDGVVGQQPHIAAGETYQYSSGALLDTPVGTMQGYYDMLDPDGNNVRANIPLFRLARPNAIN